MNKIIFLDIDGVLNVIGQGWDEFGQIFHKHFEDNLRWVIEETGAKIVLSSSWRLSGLKTMKNMWKKRELPGDLIDITPHIKNAKRGEEIQFWLNNNYISNYVIIDDDTDMLDSQKNNFVRTSENVTHPDCVDIGYGLTRKCAVRAVEILNKKH